MSRTFATAVLLGWGLLAPAWGGERTAGPPPVSVERLIEQLGDNSFRVRETAMSALKARGPEALPALRKARDHADPEVRQRLAKLLPVLEKEAALAPRRVTLRLKDRPIREAVAEVVRQTGYLIQVEQPGAQDRRLHSFHLDRATYWEAIESICAAGNLRYRHDNPGDAATLSWHSNPGPIIHRNGCFRLTALGMHRPQRPDGWLHVVLTLTTEPRLALLSVQHPILTRADDDRKMSLLAPLSIHQEQPERGRPRYGWANPIHHHPLGAYLSLPSKEARTLKSLQGTVPVLLLVERNPEIVIATVLTAKDRTFKANNTTWHIEGVDQDWVGERRRYRVKMSIREERPGDVRDTDFSWASSLRYRIELQDAEGRKYPLDEPSWQEHKPANVRGILTFTAPKEGRVGPPTRLVLHTWVTMWHRVPFEFRDLPMD